MKLFDLITAPWMITPGKLTEMVAVYETHLRGEKINIEAIEATLGGPLQRREQGYEVVNGTAIIPIEGVIARRMNLLQQVSGGVSTELLARDVRAALEDDSAEKILLEIDSPGGDVSGIFEAANLIYDGRGNKPIDAICVGEMCSAGYLLGAAAGKIHISGETDIVGSIGVICKHINKAEANKKAGHEITEITSGTYKAISSPNKPLSAEGKQDLQEKADYIYTLFVEHVAKFRGVSVEGVLEGMADGKIFIGKQAIEAGLVDGVSNMDDLIASKPAGVAGSRRVISASGDDTGMTAQTTKGKGKEKSMNLVKFKAEHADLFAQIETDAREGFVSQADVTAQLATAKEAGGKEERERIQAVQGQSMAGHEKLIGTLMFDGKTSGPEAAVAVLGAEKTLRNEAAANFKGDGDNNKVPTVAPEDGDEKTIKAAAYKALGSVDKKAFRDAGGTIVD